MYVHSSFTVKYKNNTSDYITELGSIFCHMCLFYKLSLGPNMNVLLAKSQCIFDTEYDLTMHICMINMIGTPF